MFGGYTFASTPLGGLLTIARPTQIGKPTRLSGRKDSTAILNTRSRRVMLDPQRWYSGQIMMMPSAG